MLLTELLEIQRELNDHCDGTPTEDTLMMAIIDEVGEFTHSIKSKWCWWKRYGQEFTEKQREEVLGELVDIFHFLLTGLLGSNYDRTDINYAYTSAWEDTTTALEFSTSTISYNIIRHSYLERFEDSIFWLVVLTLQQGFTREQFENCYLAKVAENKKRWEST